MYSPDDIYVVPDPKNDPAIFVHARRAQQEKRRIQHNPLIARGRTIDRTQNQLIVLRLWNSSTPLYSEKRLSNGGGYFLVWQHHGIVIDPGFDFVSEFAVNHSIDDIDLVIVTHDHPDHCDDLPKIVTLLREANESRSVPHRMHFLMSYGAFFRYSFLFQNKEIAKYTTVEKILAPSKRQLLDLELAMEFTSTQHREILGDQTGFGLKLVLLQSRSPICTIGITGDTGYTDDLLSVFSGVDLLIAHIGTLERLEDHHLLDSHLGYRGVCWLLRNLPNPPPLVLISEWGEELSGMRKAICDSLQRYFSSVKILPTDLSMRVRLPECDVFIEEEGDFAPFDQVYVHDDFGPRLVIKRRS
jgi:ribonuclease BN (tRNA processing enzyme)